MALTTRLELRQSQGLVMTPQLQQAIKLLQLSNMELSEFVDGELECNPLLETPETSANEPETRASDEPEARQPEASNEANEGEGEAKEEWLDLENGAAERDPNGAVDTEAEAIDPDAGDPQLTGLGADSWSSLPRRAAPMGDGDANLEAYVADEINLQDHLIEQLQLAFADPAKRLIGQHLIDLVDETGYLRGDLENLADRLGAPMELVEETLSILQTFDPAGVFARDLAECLAIQLKDKNRYDPAIAALIENLPLVAAHDYAALKRACRADAEDLADMIAEIKMLNPKPGLRFGKTTVQPVIPDVFVRQRPDGSWHVELNSETLPKVLVNRSYYTTVSKTATTKKDKTYLVDCLQTANWLVKSLDQRARTILKVSQEIVRQQDGFFTHGIQQLKPLNLKTVADAISMHESTISRVTSNKYMATSRGIFELKYFFSSAISSSHDGETHSSETVRHRIKQLIDNESPDKVLSDDKIVQLLKTDSIDIARRTVAKYREAMRIASSVQRRREKKAALNPLN